MGTDAEILIFDFATYRTTVIPVFLELFREGRIADWLEPFIKRRELKPWLWDKGDLARYLAGLEADFSSPGEYDLQYTYDHDWQKRWSDLHNAPAPVEELAEQVNWLFKIAVSIKCVGAGQFVGRSATVSKYSELLLALGMKDDNRIVKLLAALGKRGFLIGYQFGFGFEGINGWLDPSETAELATGLEGLPLPRYETSFVAMEQFRKSAPSADDDPAAFAAMSLSFVRTTAKIAAAENSGLLWGNNVMSPQFYREKYQLPT